MMNKGKLISFNHLSINYGLKSDYFLCDDLCYYSDYYTLQVEGLLINELEVLLHF